MENQQQTPATHIAIPVANIKRIYDIIMEMPHKYAMSIQTDLNSGVPIAMAPPTPNTLAPENITLTTAQTPIQ